MKIGIDIGGSHIAVGLVNNDGKILTKKEKNLLKEEKKNVKTTVINTIEKFIKEILQDKNLKLEDIELIGIAYPASLRKGRIGMSINLGIAGYEVAEEVKNIFNIPVYIRNDAKCAAIAEKKYGILKNYNNAIFLTIGTGIGGGAFINNNLLTTKQSDLFKVGHIIIAKDDAQCRCGKNGCFENYASIRVLKSSITEAFNINKEITGKELHNFIIENYENEKMQKVLNSYIENLSIGISNLINLFEPDAIGIGGSFAYYEDLLLDKLKKKLKENATKWNDTIPEILIATNKNDAGIIGAVTDL